jgi:tRNA threonylcarbamoyladenosine biosynthesis protein TsaE
VATTISQSADETASFGWAQAATLRRGDVVALCGDLGAGKTQFVKGLAAGLNSEATVTSPTFTLIHEYVGGRLPLYHFDFYRLDDEDEALKIGLDEYLNGDGVCVIEWADKFPELLPPETKWYRFTHRTDGARAIEEVEAGRS